jgi:hypothetical protein
MSRPVVENLSLLPDREGCVSIRLSWHTGRFLAGLRYGVDVLRLPSQPVTLDRRIVLLAIIGLRWPSNGLEDLTTFVLGPVLVLVRIVRAAGNYHDGTACY